MSMDPKHLEGMKKVSYSATPETVLAEVAVGMMEGAWKYGRSNYLAEGRECYSTIYLDALDRHIKTWKMGEDIDPDSGLSHITKAICTLMVMRASMIQGTFVDDRAPRAPDGFLGTTQGHVTELRGRMKDTPMAEPTLEKNQSRDRGEEA